MVKGTDIVKQWGTTLDGDTRPNRIQLDGQMRELDEDELAERKKHAEYFRLDKSAEFEKKYLKAAETLKIQGENSKIEIDELTPCLRRKSDERLSTQPLLMFYQHGRSSKTGKAKEQYERYFQE
jgi:hypothetical protein